MALKTLTKIINLSYSSSSDAARAWLKAVFDATDFAFDDCGGGSDSYVWGKYTSDRHDDYVAIAYESFTNFHVRASISGLSVQDLGDLYSSKIIPMSGKTMVSIAYDDDFFCVFAIGDSKIPSEITSADSAIGILFAKTKRSDSSGDTWTLTGWKLREALGESGSLGNFCNVYGADDTLTDANANHPTRSVCINYNASVLATAPCLGRNTLYPEKVTLITDTPEPYIGSVGYIDFKGKKYYKLGVFLIDPEK